MCVYACIGMYMRFNRVCTYVYIRALIVRCGSVQKLIITYFEVDLLHGSGSLMAVSIGHVHGTVTAFFIPRHDSSGGMQAPKKCHEWPWHRRASTLKAHDSCDFPQMPMKCHERALNAMTRTVHRHFGSMAPPWYIPTGAHGGVMAVSWPAMARHRDCRGAPPESIMMYYTSSDPHPTPLHPRAIPPDRLLRVCSLVHCLLPVYQTEVGLSE